MIMKIVEKLSHPLKFRSAQEPVAWDSDYFSQSDIELFKTGAHYRIYKKMGAHLTIYNNVAGCYFSVWAPGAKRVSVVGDFNGWNKKSDILNVRDDHSGIWEGFIPGVVHKDHYKFHITSKHSRHDIEKADPYAFQSESSPNTASIISCMDYQWGDQQWMDQRKRNNFNKEPMSVYEVHVGSWRRHDDGSFLTYRELADELIPYVVQMGFTHIELMPLMEHPFYGSWGYQALSYFAPSARYGSPNDLMYFIDQCHQQGIGVLLDWVASHFPSDNHGLAKFDGTHLYECDELHPDWHSCVFNLGRHETVEFLISSVLYWLEYFHIDGLRVDAVASMLYLDYSRKDGEWKPNFYGGRENLQAISFIRRLNEVVKEFYPDVQMIAEDSTAWPKVSKPSSQGGLHFDMKWNMGWMHDTLEYFRKDCKTRSKCHEDIAFCLYYAFSENFVLSLSHDEVVYEKSSLIGKMPGKDEEKFANLRALFAYMYSHPGKKLMFMGSEFAQWAEWNHDTQLDWDLLQHSRHQTVQTLVKDLNNLYKNEPALHSRDFSAEGFEWLDMGQDEQCVFSYLRKGEHTKDDILVICNFKNKLKRHYTVGISTGGLWEEILNSDDKKYGGNGYINDRGAKAVHEPWVAKGHRYREQSSCHTKECSITLNVAPLSVIYLKNKIQS